MFKKLRHWFTPHHTNNFRARMLHNAGLFAVILAFSSFSLITRLIESSSLHILGFTSTISVDEVVSQTNAQRLSYGLPPLRLSTRLSQAAAGKAADMFANNYWAHNSPSGITPWDFILDTGYDYSYAGENLAKDFSNTPRMIDAWMASETHKANIVSDKYTDIGIAIVPGKLQGVDTVLVVQMFATPSTTVGEVPTSPTLTAQNQIEPVPAVAGSQEEAPAVLEISAPTAKQSDYLKTPSPEKVTTYSRFNEFDFQKGASIATTVLFILVLILDLIIAESQKLTRRVSKNWAHLIFINVILFLITIANAGRIL